MNEKVTQGEHRAILRDFGLAKAAPMEWIKCSERLPEKHGKYLTFANRSWGTDIDVNEFWPHDRVWAIGRVTHWAPLPHPPTDARGREET